jgi:aryl-alcohol dehydrogenase-like predicted oxidoreductase
VERLQHFAKERGHTLLELAFSWLLAHRAVASVIAGATKPEQIEANAKAADWVLNAEELAEVDRIAGVASLSVP